MHDGSEEEIDLKKRILGGYISLHQGRTGDKKCPTKHGSQPYH